MSKIDDDLKIHVRRSLVTWMNYAATFLAGMVIGILICLAFG